MGDIVSKVDPIPRKGWGFRRCECRQRVSSGVCAFGRGPVAPRSGRYRQGHSVRRWDECGRSWFRSFREIQLEMATRRGCFFKCVWVAGRQFYASHSRGTASTSTRRASGSHGAMRGHSQLVVDALHRIVRQLRVQVRQDALACCRIVRPSFRNGIGRDRAAHFSHSSSSAGASSGVAYKGRPHIWFRGIS